MSIDGSYKQTRLRRIRNYLGFTFMGGIVYWGPYVLCRWVLGGNMIWLISITILVPLIVAYVYFIARRKKTHLESPRVIALLMLLGIWLFGPLGLALGELSRGVILDLRGFLSLWAAFPVSTFILATYNFSIWSLMITTLMLMIFAVIFRRKNKS